VRSLQQLIQKERMKSETGNCVLRIVGEQSDPVELKDLGNLLLEIGSLLMSSGANTERVRKTIQRISGALGYSTEVLITYRALSLTITDNSNEYHFNSVKRTSHHGVNFKLVSGISRMSWRVVEEQWSIEQIKEEMDRLTALPHYPRMVTLLMVGLAGAAFCRFAGGSVSDLFIVFFATVAGLFVRQVVTKMAYNPYVCIYLAAFTAALVAGLPIKLGLGHHHEHAFATAVLFLIPGVPLINSFSDVIDGNLQNGVIRGLNGLVISFSIALGLLTAMFIYQF
jgi:uncharacterized membrane protein YjjP (DUF1212 family)